MTLWRDEQDSGHWWCDLRAEVAHEAQDLAGLFFDVAFRQRDPRVPSEQFYGFPNVTEFAWALAQSYASTDWPCEREDRTFWIAAFRSAGFLADGAQAPDARPARPITLFRAAGEHDLRNPPGLSWSTSRRVAEWFARYNDAHGHRSYVFEAEVPPERLLARYRSAVAQPDAVPPLGGLWGDQWLAEVDSGSLR